MREKRLCWEVHPRCADMAGKKTRLCLNLVLWEGNWSEIRSAFLGNCRLPQVISASFISTGVEQPCSQGNGSLQQLTALSSLGFQVCMSWATSWRWRTSLRLPKCDGSTRW